MEKLALFTEENKIQNANPKQHLNTVCLAIHIWNAILFLMDSPEGAGDQASIQVQTCNSQLYLDLPFNLHALSLASGYLGILTSLI